MNWLYWILGGVVVFISIVSIAAAWAIGGGGNRRGRTH